MAHKSTGTIGPFRPVVDPNSAFALLDTVYHWKATKVNSEDGPPGVEVTITHAGKRVSARRRTFVDALNAAMRKLNGSDKTPTLKLAGA